MAPGDVPRSEEPPSPSAVGSRESDPRFDPHNRSRASSLSFPRPSSFSHRWPQRRIRNRGSDRPRGVWLEVRGKPERRPPPCRSRIPLLALSPPDSRIPIPGSRRPPLPVQCTSVQASGEERAAQGTTEPYCQTHFAQSQFRGGDGLVRLDRHSNHPPYIYNNECSGQRGSAIRDAYGGPGGTVPSQRLFRALARASPRRGGAKGQSGSQVVWSLGLSRPDALGDGSGRAVSPPAEAPSPGAAAPRPTEPRRPVPASF